MLFDCLLLRYGELFLKGKNQGIFEDKLIANIKKITAVKNCRRMRGRVILPYFPDHHSIKRVFGVGSYSPAIKVGKTMEEIKAAALSLFQGKTGTFRVATKRSDKTFPGTSLQINAEVGRYIEAHLSLQFHYEHPDHLLHIEINTAGAFIFTEIIPCFGGLPEGVEGKALLLVEDEASLIAGLLMMRRGCSLLPVSFQEQDLSLLNLYSSKKLKLHLLQNYEELEELSKQYNIPLLITGEIFSTYTKQGNLTTLRPLIAYTPSEIKKELEKYSFPSSNTSTN
ncbi:MAG TPA: THUMP domain-containing protein [Candidatus Nanoarchaeia archaeon]|nr:THUMP domain-containing protein [Candidatus Nanoarchaeia archaeon]